jgi:polyribonucleotide nucleotidyltransferase
MGLTTHEFTVGRSQVRLETGEIAKQASGSILIHSGGMTLLVAATVSAEPREGADFFPLMVDFEERMYAAGRFPGGFFKREGRPSEDAILNGRRIDRTLRPVFPKHFRNDTQIVITTLSCEQVTPTDVMGIIGASAALGISRIPFPKLVAAVRVGFLDGEFIINPSKEETDKAQMNLLVSGTRDYINMIEDESHEVPEDMVLEGLRRGHEEVKHIITELEAFIKKAGAQEKLVVTEPTIDDAIYAKLKSLVDARMKAILPADSKSDLYGDVSKAKKECCSQVIAENLDADPALLASLADKFAKAYAREFTVTKGVRVDGRGPDDIRPISGRTSILPRVHGSALFTRGQTQVLATVTLGSFADRQRIDSLMLEANKRFVHHYNFPPYSVGEVRFMRGPGRRDIGHGALAEHSLLPAVPTETEFPYAIRVVSEVTESNASSSMASVCAGCMALMDAGVPLVRPVAGVSTGLIYENDEKYVLLSDLSGFEDFNGDMDFKVAGSEQGITAIQLDVKIEGLTLKMIEETLERARVGRKYILEQMREIIAAPREALSEYAPTLMILKIDPEQIGMVIGPSGKNIKKLEAESGADVEIDEDGTVYFSGVDRAGVERAHAAVRAMTMTIETGQIFEAKVVSIVPFGAFLELVPGRDGLLHISNVADHRIEKVEDVLSIGDVIRVKVREVDDNGKINLIRDDIEYTRPTGPREGGPRRDSGPRRDGPRRDGGGRPPRR